MDEPGNFQPRAAALGFRVHLGAAKNAGFRMLGYGGYGLRQKLEKSTRSKL